MKKLFLVLVIMICCQLVQSQTLSKTGVLKIRLRNSGAIIQNNQVKGYYYFYNVEKQDRGNNNYLLSVYDENLRLINETTIVRPRNYLLVDGVFNGTAFGFLFYDTKKKSVELISFDNTLKQIGSAIKVLNNTFAQASFNMLVQGMDPSQAYLVSVPDKGFLYYGFIEGKKSQYDIQFYDNNMKLQWYTRALPDAMNIETAVEAFQSGQYIGSLIIKRKNTGTKNVEFDLLVQNLSDGKTLFRKPLVTTKYSVSLADVYFDEAKNNFIVFGEYYDINDKELKSQSEGFITLGLDTSGKVVFEKVNSWAKEISQATPVNDKGKFEGNNTNILFHDIIRAKDGQIFAVGEQYKKAASAAGIASNVLAAAGGGYSTASNVQLNIYNIVIFEFNSDFSIKKVHLFEKDKNVVALPYGSDFLSSKLLSYYAKAVGGFDYTFSQVSSDKSTFVVNYINYDRERGEKAKNVLGSIVYTPEKTFTVDKLALNRKSSDYFVFRAKEGYVLVTEYFKKEKRLDSRLEKINY